VASHVGNGIIYLMVDMEALVHNHHPLPFDSTSQSPIALRFTQIHRASRLLVAQINERRISNF
ncbi:unnamed protein product, partial [Ilex paraguariensis]